MVCLLNSSAAGPGLVVSLTLGALLLPSMARADPFHHRNLMVGERAAGLGGAYVALSDDTAGLFHNPAGTPYSQELASATVNVLNRVETEYEEFFPDGASLSSTSSGLVPSYFGVQRSVGPYVLGFSIAVTDSLSERQIDSTAFAMNGATVDEFLSGDIDVDVYNAGPSVAMNFGGGWSGGMTLYGSYRDLRESRSIGGEATRTGVEAGTTERLNVLTSYRIEDTQYGLRPVLGLQYRASRGSLGLTVSRDFGIDREYHYFYRSSRNLVSQNADGVQTPLQVLNIDSDSKSSELQRYPWQISAGASFLLTPSWRIALQADHYTEVTQTVIAGADANSPPVTRRFRDVTNFSIGTEVSLAHRTRVRGALYSDYANASVDDAGKFERREDIDLIGGALGFTYDSGKRQYKAGFYYSQGSGKGTLGDLGELNFSGEQAVGARSRNLTLFFGLEI